MRGKLEFMSEVTRILNAIEHGNPHAANELLPLVYDELRKLAAQKLAQEKPGQTLEATALVHEAYLRLVDVEQSQQWNSRGHFFAAAAEAMRRILVENARSKREKRGGDWQRIDFEKLDVTTAISRRAPRPDDALGGWRPRRPRRPASQAPLFCRPGTGSAAAALGVSTATAYRHWAYARAWLQGELSKRRIA